MTGQFANLAGRDVWGRRASPCGWSLGSGQTTYSRIVLGPSNGKPRFPNFDLYQVGGWGYRPSTWCHGTWTIISCKGTENIGIGTCQDFGAMPLKGSVSFSSFIMEHGSCCTQLSNILSQSCLNVWNPNSNAQKIREHRMCPSNSECHSLSVFEDFTLW